MQVTLHITCLPVDDFAAVVPCLPGFISEMNVTCFCHLMPSYVDTLPGMLVEIYEELSLPIPDTLIEFASPVTTPARLGPISVSSLSSMECDLYLGSRAGSSQVDKGTITR